MPFIGVSLDFKCWQQLLAHPLRDRIQPCAGSPGQRDAFHYWLILVQTLIQILALILFLSVIQLLTPIRLLPMSQLGSPTPLSVRLSAFFPHRFLILTPLRADFSPISPQTRGFCAFRARFGPIHYAGVNGRVKDVVRANDVGFDGLHREKLAARDLLEGGGVEDVVHAAHRALERGPVAHVAYVEFDLARDLRIIGLVLMPHVVLLLLVPRENADLLDVCLEKPPEDGIAKAPGPPGDHECFVSEDGHIWFIYILFLLLYPSRAHFRPFRARICRFSASRARFCLFQARIRCLSPQIITI